MFTDYHVHTEFSDDSDYLMEDVIKDAIKMNMDEICFTDHVDYGIKRDFDDPRGMLYRKGGPGEPEKMPLANVDYPKYFEKIALLKKKYPEIVIKQGMELVCKCIRLIFIKNSLIDILLILLSYLVIK